MNLSNIKKEFVLNEKIYNLFYRFLATVYQEPQIFLYIFGLIISFKLNHLFTWQRFNDYLPCVRLSDNAWEYGDPCLYGHYILTRKVVEGRH